MRIPDVGLTVYKITIVQENFGETQIGKVVYRDFSLVNSTDVKWLTTAPDVHRSEQPVNFHVEDRSPPGTVWPSRWTRLLILFKVVIKTTDYPLTFEKSIDLNKYNKIVNNNNKRLQQ